MLVFHAVHFISFGAHCCMGTTKSNEKSIMVLLIEILFHFRHMIHSGLTINNMDFCQKYKMTHGKLGIFRKPQAVRKIEWAVNRNVDIITLNRVRDDILELHNMLMEDHEFFIKWGLGSVYTL